MGVDPAVGGGRLAHFNAERGEILAEVERRVMEIYSPTREEGLCLELLNEAAYLELQRLETARSRRARRAAKRWRRLAAGLSRMAPSETTSRLAELIAYCASDIAGNFDGRVYRLANDVLPPALSVLFSPVRGVRQGLASLRQMEDRLVVEGAVEEAREAAKRGTLVVAPTHSSNMDSIVVGFLLNRSRLPPVTYGAGKNLFTNPLISFFMRNLGAYRVDRRLRYRVYKDVLKMYSQVLIERGFHSLFFPGGTRSRSNAVENRLKLGLLGTALQAFVHQAASGVERPNIAIVPVTINYRLVLEAQTLIDDFLVDRGKSRYIIDDDEFTRLGRVIEFVRKMLAHESSVVIRVGQALDPFGNVVDSVGRSIDTCGRVVDATSYLRDPNGVIVRDAQRDAAYTRRLGQQVALSFQRDTVLLETHIACRAIYDALISTYRTHDVYRLLRMPKVSVVVNEVLVNVDRLRHYVANTPRLGRVSASTMELPASDVVDQALRVLSSYHAQAPAVRRGDVIHVNAVKLLYYYQNRTSHIAGREQR